MKNKLKVAVIIPGLMWTLLKEKWERRDEYLELRTLYMSHAIYIMSIEFIILTLNSQPLHDVI